MVANLWHLLGSVKQRIKLSIVMLVGAIVAIIKPKDIQQILDDHLEMAEKRNNKYTNQPEIKHAKAKHVHHRRSKNKSPPMVKKHQDNTINTDVNLNSNVRLRKENKKHPK
jgi:hypothetical protein